MREFIYPLTVSAFFGLIVAHSVEWRAPSLGMPVFAATLLLWLASYLVPSRLFAYSNDQPAPEVLSALMRRATIAVALVVVAAALAMFISGLWTNPSFVQEMYAVTLFGILLFHGFGGPFAYHVVYLQETKQYNSNQLAAVLIAVSLMLFVLTLFFLNLDFGTVRDTTTQTRDLLILTTVLIGYGWTVYKVAHH